MLSTLSHLIFELSMGAIALLAAGAAFFSHRRAKAASDYSSATLEWVQENNTKSLSLKQLGEIQIALTEHDDLIHTTIDALKKLRSRAGMRELRKRRSVEGDVPDSRSDPEGWKRAMRLKLNHGSHIDRGD